MLAVKPKYVFRSHRVMVLKATIIPCIDLMLFVNVIDVPAYDIITFITKLLRV